MAQKRKPSLWGAALILIWLAVIFAFYFAFHRPFTPEFFFQFVSSLLEIAIIAAITVLAGAVGAKILPALNAPHLARLALRAALGFGVLSFSYLFIGSLVGTSGWLAWAFLFGLLFMLWRDIPVWGSDLSGFRESWRSKDGFLRFTGLLVALLFIFALLTALAPPLKFDTLAYHLSLPQQYILDGRINFVEGNVFWGFPQLPHMLSTWALALGAQWGALIGWAMGLLCVLGLASHLSARLGQRAAWVVVAALLSGYSLAASLGWAYVDWTSMLMAWAMLFSMDLWIGKRETRFATLAGVFAGLAFGSKYTAGLLVPLGLIVLLLRKPRAWSAAGLYLAAAFFIAFPWLLKNVMVTGNPLYPLLFLGGEMDAFRVAYLQGFAPQASWMDVVLLPLRATLFGIEGARIAGAPGYEASVGPLLLALGALAIFSDQSLKRDQRGLKLIATIIAIGGLLLWVVAGVVSGHLIRTHLYYSIFPAFAMLAGFGCLRLSRINLKNLKLEWVVAGLICFVLFLNVVQVGQETIKSRVIPYLSGQISAQQYVDSNLGSYGSAMQTLQQLPAGARVLMLWDSRGYYCVSLCDPDELIDRWPHDIATNGTPDAAIAAWRTAAYTHVLYYALGASFIHEDPQHFHAFDLVELEIALDGLQLVQDFNGDYLLYSLAE